MVDASWDIVVTRALFRCAALALKKENRGKENSREPAAGGAFVLE
jgi:hypothetical protein